MRRIEVFLPMQKNVSAHAVHGGLDAKFPACEYVNVLLRFDFRQA
jgi:hypothetical protein